MLTKFDFIEDYIEYIGGYKSGSINRLLLTLGNKTVPKTVSLARYDVAIVESFCNQIVIKNLGFTEKQAQLAKTIVAKYEQQLKLSCIGMPDSFDRFRLPIRTVSHNYSVEIDRQNQKFIVRFPYNVNLIEKFRQTKTSDEISAQFDYDGKYWILPLTEYSLNYIKAVCGDTTFHYDEAVQSLWTELVELEDTPYKIELCEIDGKLTITNAAQSLLQYVGDTVGELTHDNLPKLIDLSSTLGYTVSSELIQQFNANCVDDLERSLITNKTVKVKLKDFDLERFMEYAASMGRTPVYAYLQAHKNLTKFKHPHLRYLNQSWPDSNTPIKLFITQSPILIGVKKNTLRRLAEKTIILDHEIM